MKLISTIPTRRKNKLRAAWTLMEMMVAIFCGSILLAAFVSTTVLIGKTMMSVGNYNDLNRKSRVTLDWFSRDVRNASAVSTDSTSTQLTLTNTFNGTTVIVYTWDGSNVVSRASIANGVTTRFIMLTNCDTFAMNFYQRNPTNNFSFIASASPSQIKLVSISWRCSRSVMGSILNTESVQTANVVMRN
jgi:hypothetical protein